MQRHKAICIAANIIVPYH